MSTIAIVGLLVAIAGCGGDRDVRAETTDAPAATAATAALAEPTTSAGEVGAGAPTLAGTSWNVTHHASEIYGGPTNVWPGSKLTISFNDDGTVTGSTGCNTFGATYELSGDYVTKPGIDEVEGQLLEIGMIEATEEACENEDWADQEREFLEALADVDQWLIGTGLGGADDLLLISLEDGLEVEGEPAG